MAFGGFERMVAFRYLRPRRQEGFVSVVALCSLLGIMVGVATLIIVMSVMNGFRSEFLKQILGFNGDITVLAQNGAFPDYDRLTQAVRKIPGVTDATPIIERQVVISVGNNWSGVSVRGEELADLQRQGDIAHHITGGALADLDDDGIVLGDRLAFTLGVRVGDSVSVVSPQGTATPFGTYPRIKPYRVAATFDTGSQYDAGYAFVTLKAAQIFFNVANGATGIQIFVADGNETWRYRAPIAAAVGDQGRIYEWQNGNTAFLNAVATERNVMFLILSLIILVAALNVVSSMIMLVKDKGRDIAILRTMGATRGMILRIFIMAGASVGVVGTLLGFALGLAFADNIESIRQVLQYFTGTNVFASEIYFLSRLPAEVDPGEVTAVVGIAFALSFLATIYPALRAARLDPVEALRYE